MGHDPAATLGASRKQNRSQRASSLAGVTPDAVAASASRACGGRSADPAATAAAIFVRALADKESAARLPRAHISAGGAAPTTA